MNLAQVAVLRFFEHGGGFSLPGEPCASILGATFY